jgi:hypothetical protein
MSRFSRRRFLGGAGTLLALPFFDSLAFGDAGAPPKIPERLVFYYAPNGIIPSSWNPTPFGANWVAKDLLKPLNAHHQDITIISGLDAMGYEGGAGPHTRATGTFLTCKAIEDTPTGQVSGGISVDQIAAQYLGEKTRFSSLQLGGHTSPDVGFCEEMMSCAYLKSISWAGPKTPLPKTVEPKAMFDLLFAGYDPGATLAQIQKRKKAKKSVLDVVFNQAKSLRKWLGTDDQYRMDEYMDGVRALEKQVTSYLPICPTNINPEEAYTIPERMEMMTDLMVLALKCDQTRVVSFMLDDGFAATTYDWLGLTDGHHWYTHHEKDPDMMAAVDLISTWQVEQFAMLLDKMKAVKEGASTLLDHSLVMFGYPISECNNHDNVNVPTILAGRAGGHNPGESIQVAEHTPRANFYTAMLHMVGIELDSFGTYGTGPLLDIMK